MVQWLGVHASDEGLGSTLVRDLRSHKMCDVAKKKKKETTSLIRCHRPDADSGTSDDRRACCAVVRVSVGLL